MDDDLQEARETHAHAHRWLDSLVVAGMPERVAIVGTLQALIERMLVSSTPQETARYLRDQAGQMDTYGETLRNLLIERLKGAAQ